MLDRREPRHDGGECELQFARPLVTYYRPSRRACVPSVLGCLSYNRSRAAWRAVDGRKVQRRSENLLRNVALESRTMLDHCLIVVLRGIASLLGGWIPQTMAAWQPAADAPSPVQLRRRGRRRHRGGRVAIVTRCDAVGRWEWQWMSAPGGIELTGIIRHRLNDCWIQGDLLSTARRTRAWCAARTLRGRWRSVHDRGIGADVSPADRVLGHGESMRQFRWP